MIVVDLGCANLGHDSVSDLIERFQPELLLGFDPGPDIEDTVERRGDTIVVLRRIAAWTYGGNVNYVRDGWASYTTQQQYDEATVVPCFDLVELLLVLPKPIVLKLNIEGAEYPLLTALADYDADERLDRVLVQWHAKERIQLACPVEEYP